MTPWTKRVVRAVLAALTVLAAAAAVRAAFAPRESPAPTVDLSPAARARLGAEAASSREDLARLRERLPHVEVLLVGEDHFYRESVRFLTFLLDSVQGRRVSLLLELPAGLQPEVDRDLETGASACAEAAFRDGAALPYGDILSWAHAHRSTVSRVMAMDEDRATVVVHRALLFDTRNETMARAILTARRERPTDLVVAYGGQMHMMLGGRYRYDRDDRVPAGARVLRAGVPRERVLSVLLSGAEPFQYFVDEPIFGAPAGRDLFDYFVNLGELTRVAGP